MSPLDETTNAARLPLQVVVVWHPDARDAAAIADHLFRQLCGDPQHPSIRALGIDVRFRTSRRSDTPPAGIDYDVADRTMVVVLVDDAMVVAEGWGAYVEAILDDSSRRSDVRLFPVALTANFVGLSPRVAEKNFARLQIEEPAGAGVDAGAEDDRPTPTMHAVTTVVLHGLCRFLGGDDVEIQVFISHAKRDGLGIAQAVQQRLHANDGLADFLDTTDIPPGTTFADVITDGVAGSSVLLAVLTDNYASRQWCRLEVLEAKRRWVPLIVLTAIDSGEVRSFPYLGNVPVVRWRGPDHLQGLVQVLLREVLRRLWFPLCCHMVGRMAALPAGIRPIVHPPELLSVLHLRSDHPTESSRLLYPDPPLGVEELRLLSVLDPGLDAITPTQALTR